LPKAVQQRTERQTVAEMLIMAADRFRADRHAASVTCGQAAADQAAKQEEGEGISDRSMSASTSCYTAITIIVGLKTLK